MERLKKYYYILFISIFMLFYTLPVYAYTNVGDSAGANAWNVNDIKWEETDEAIPVIAYIYIEDGLIPYPKVTIDFNGEFYVECDPTSYISDRTYQDNKVICRMFYLPKGTYAFLPSCESFKSKDADFLMIDNERKLSSDGKMDIIENGNEVFIVYGSKEWIKEYGERKLNEIFSLYSSYEEESGEYDDIAEAFQNNPDLDVVIIDGVEYTKQDLLENGYEEFENKPEVIMEEDFSIPDAKETTKTKEKDSAKNMNFRIGEGSVAVGIIGILLFGLVIIIKKIRNRKEY